MKGATPNEKQLEENKNNRPKSKEQTAKASRGNIYETTRSWTGAGMSWEDSESRSHEPTG